jgi:hypothetical protein
MRMAHLSQVRRIRLDYYPIEIDGIEPWEHEEESVRPNVNVRRRHA